MSEPSVQLAKFRVFSVLGESFSILFRNIVPFMLISIFIMSPTYIYVYVSDPYTIAEDPVFMATSLIEIILSYFLTAVLVFGVFQSLRGQPVSIYQSLMQGLRVRFPVIGGVVIMGLIWAAMGGRAFGATFALSGSSGGIISVFVFVIAIYVTCILWVIVPAAVVEGRVLSSFGRSMDLTKGNRWRVLGLLILVGIFSGIVGQIAISVGEAIGSNSSIILLTWAATAATSAIGAVVITVAYYRLCLVKDGVPEDEIAAVFD